MTSRPPDRQHPVRFYRNLQVGALVLGVLILGVALALFLVGSADWWLLAVVGVFNIVTAVTTLRALRRTAPPDVPPPPGDRGRTDR